MKQKCLLRNETDLFAERLLLEGPQILAIDAHAARGRIVKAQNEGENGALARAARANERVGFPGLDPQIQVGHGIGDAAGVAKGRVIELDQPLAVAAIRCASGASCTVGAVIHDRENFGGRLDRLLHDDVHPAQGFDRLVEENNSDVERDKTGRAQVGVIDVKQGQTDAKGGDHFHERAGGFHRPDDAHHVLELQAIAAAKQVFLVLLARE